MAPSPNVVAPEVVEKTEAAAKPAFSVALGNFEGPFDLLLQLISRHELDITEVSLSQVTDEFIGYLRGLDATEELDQATEFLVVAATLLDLKVAGLLPAGELVDAEDAALFEARDLLFARLLQYRAFKEAAHWFTDRLEQETQRHTRTVRLEDKYRQHTPELVWRLSLGDFAALAALAVTPRELPTIGLDHLHAPLVSIREQAACVVARLQDAAQSGRILTFRDLTADADHAGIVIARFLAVLELYRHGALDFDQPEPLGDLMLRWVADDWTDASLATLGADDDA